jgi:hypothetical protein
LSSCSPTTDLIVHDSQVPWARVAGGPEAMLAPCVYIPDGGPFPHGGSSKDSMACLLSVRQLGLPRGHAE